ncbi:MAG: hypothetical protein D9V47_09255 [Clostridia bacterium]|nr:MAG: hypothetical protein D9V47_09255 [Clostridia bacterium]
MAKLYTLSPLQAGKISDLAQDFLADLGRRGYSSHTVRAYRSALAGLAEALEDKDAAEITAQDLAAALDKENWDTETRAARQAAVRSFFKWLSDQGCLARNPAAGLGSVKRCEGLPRPIPQGDLDKVLRAADDLPLALRTLVRLLADTGLRAGEALALDAADVTWDKGQEAVTIRRGKGGRGRVVPVTVDMKCYPLLRRLCREQQQGPLFVTQGARGRIMTGHITGGRKRYKQPVWLTRDIQFTSSGILPSPAGWPVA